MTVYAVALTLAERDYLLRLLAESEPLDELRHADLTEIIENALTARELQGLRELASA